MKGEVEDFTLPVLYPTFACGRIHALTLYVQFTHNTNQLQLNALQAVFLVDVTPALLLPFAVEFSIKQHRAFVSLEQLLI